MQCCIFCQRRHSDVESTIPPAVKDEVFAALSLPILAFMDLRLLFDELVTVSDAPETGGGLCQSVGVNYYSIQFGTQCSQRPIRGKIRDLPDDKQLSVISFFDGISSLRVAFDTIQAKVGGYVAVEDSKVSQKVSESHFPIAVPAWNGHKAFQKLMRRWLPPGC